MLDEVINGILDWLYPPRCMSCGCLLPLATDIATISGEKYFCINCWRLLEWINEPVCGKCGRPIDVTEADGTICKDCLGKTFHFERNYSVLVYDDALKDLIHRFKYHGRPGYARGLGTILFTKLPRLIFEGVDYIIPVPMYRKKERKRGYNQAELLARTLSRHTGIPMRTDLLVRTKDTRAQSSLDARAREHNLSNAFEIYKKNQIIAKKIIIVDDIYTTGSTLSACSSVFKQNGSSKVYGVTLSATIRD